MAYASKAHETLQAEGVSFVARRAEEDKPLYFVYQIRSLSFPEKRYTGFTEDVEDRVKAHNAGESKHTSKYCPWELVTYQAFKDRQKALEFEYYLKTGSGMAFANKRFW